MAHHGFLQLHAAVAFFSRSVARQDFEPELPHFVSGLIARDAVAKLHFVHTLLTSVHS